MEIQEIKESLDSLRSRYLICKYNRAFQSNEFVQVVLEVINDEAEFVTKLENETPDVFDHQSRSRVCYVKDRYFLEFFKKDKLDMYEEYNYEESDAKIEILKEYLEKKIIIVEPYFYFNDNRKQFYKNGTVIDIIQVPYIPEEYISIPVIPFGSEQNFIENKNFSMPSVSNKIVGRPDYVCYKDSIYKVKLKALESNDCYWEIDTVAEDAKVELDIDLDDYEQDYRILFRNYSSDESSYMFISKDVLLEYATTVKKKESLNTENIVREAIEETDNGDNESYQGKVLRKFSNYAKNNNLCYNINDIYNFYTCVCASQLIILAGMSGTGKTKLPLKFAEYFNMTEHDNTLLFVPVSPSFTEPSDILGYLNPNTGLYTSSETRLVEFLKHAMDNPNKMHMVIFDEMNLSQIEFWFAPFISILEKDVGDRNLNLYSKAQRCINEEKYPSSIKIGNNIIFVGTINLDETTKNISDRLLDRAYIINLKKETFMNYQAQQTDAQENVNKFDEGDFKEKLMPSDEMYTRKYIDKFTTKELEFFDKIHQELNKIDGQKGISFRSVKNISLFLNNKPAELSKQQAFDYAFKQTVMKKINGSTDSIGDFIGNEIVNGESNGILTQILNDYSEISEFKECRNEIKNKVLELKKYGYAR